MVRAEQTQDTLERLEVLVADAWTEGRDFIENSEEPHTFQESEQFLIRHAANLIDNLSDTLEFTNVVFRTGANFVRNYLTQGKFFSAVESEIMSILDEYIWNEDGSLNREDSINT